VHLGPVPEHLDRSAIRPGEHDDDVDVVVGVPDRHPPAAAGISGGREPGPLHDFARHGRPLGIGEPAIAFRDPHGALPDRPIHRVGHQPQRQAEPAGEPAEAETTRYGRLQLV